MFLVKLLGEDGKYHNYEMSVFDISMIRPIDGNNIDKGTVITTTHGFVYESNQPIDTIMLAKWKVESDAVSKILLEVAKRKKETKEPVQVVRTRRKKA